MSTALAHRPTPPLDPTIVQSVLLSGDLSKLTPEQRISYYNRVCESVGLNPLTQPFAYLRLNGKEVLYAKKDCTEQLRFIHTISIDPKGFTREVIEGCYVVTAPASMPNGRTDVSTGAVAIDGLKGEARANAMMKAETKAKRRVTLSICGLGMLDETEAETLHQPVVVHAPAAVRHEPPPEGYCRIVSAVSTQWGGEVTVVDARGEEATFKTTDRQCAELCEQIAQEGTPVTLELQEITRGKNAGKEKLVGVKRYTEPTPAENAALDAEIAAKDAIL